jgi:phosphatidylinositol alpha-1,6-mannosyltransferase
MERLNQHLLEAFSPDWRPALCGPEGCSAYASADTMVRENPIKPLPKFLLATFFAAIRLARRIRPQHVVAGSGLSAPMAWFAARLTGAKLTVYLHGLDVIVPSRVYQLCWLPFIRRCDLVLVNSGNTAALAQSRGVPEQRIRVLHPGTDLPALDAGDGGEFRRQFGLAEQPILLSVGRLTRRKGLAEFVGKALPGIVDRYPEIRLVVIGAEASDALHGAVAAERERIEAAAESAGEGANLLFVGRCDEAMLGAAYRSADCHVFPVLEMPGDVEGFGMVALEAAANGLRTVAFSVGGVPDAVLDGTTGILVPPEDYTAFKDATLQLLVHPRSAAQEVSCREFAAGKHWTVFAARLRNLLRESRG